MSSLKQNNIISLHDYADFHKKNRLKSWPKNGFVVLRVLRFSMYSPCSLCSGVMVKEEGEKTAIGFRQQLTTMDDSMMANQHITA